MVLHEHLTENNDPVISDLHSSVTCTRSIFPSLTDVFVVIDNTLLCVPGSMNDDNLEGVGGRVERSFREGGMKGGRANYLIV